MAEYFNNKGERLESWFEAHLDAERAAFVNSELDRRLSDLRQKRNALLAETDFYALGDVTMSNNMKTYRQDLRDLTNGLDTVDKVKNVTWPTKP